MTDPHVRPDIASREGEIDRHTLTGTSRDSYGNEFDIRATLVVDGDRKVLRFVETHRVASAT